MRTRPPVLSKRVLGKLVYDQSPLMEVLVGTFQMGGLSHGKPGPHTSRIIEYCLKKPYKTYVDDIRCDVWRVFEHTSYFVTVGSSNTVRLRLLGNYRDISGFLGLLSSSGNSGSGECFLGYRPGSFFSLLPHDSSWLAIFSISRCNRDLS